MDADIAPRTSSPVLIGRRAELDRIATAVSNPPAVVLVEGEAGIGKSRLLRELPAELGGRPVLTGHCRARREPFPYGPVLEALAELGPLLPPPAELNPVTGALRPLVPELGPFLPPAPAAPADPGVRRHQTFRAVRQLLDAAGKVVLLVEDLHWADDGARDLLRFLADDPPPRLSLVGTFRRSDCPLGLPLGAAARPAADVTVTRVTVPPLTREQTHALASAHLGDEPVGLDFAARLHERTAGIPLLIEETLHAMGTGAPRLDDLAVPDVVREAVAERLAGLPHSAVALVRAAAVAGVPVPEADLAEIAGLDPGDTGPALVAALAAGAVVETATGRYGFRHALARQAVHDGVPGPDRARLHRRSMAVLARWRPAPLAELAAHARHAGEHARWVRYGEAAAEHALAANDVPGAVALLRDLVADPALAPADLVRLARRLGRVAAHGTDHTALVSVLRALLDDRRVPPDVRGELRLALGLLLFRQPALADGRAQVAAALGDVPPGSPAACRAGAVLANPVLGPAPLAHHRRWAAVARRRGPRLAEPALRFAVLADDVAADLMTGVPGAGERAERLGTAGEGPEDRRELARAHANLAYADLLTGHYRRAHRWLTSAEGQLAEAELPFTAAALRSTGLCLAWRTGAWAGLAEAAAGLRAGYPAFWPVVSELSYVQGALDAAGGDFFAAVDGFDRPDLTDPGRTCTPVVLAVHAAKTWLLLRRGQAPAAVAEGERGLAVLRAKRVWAWAGDLLPAVAAARTAHGTDVTGLVAELDTGLSGVDAPLAAAASVFCHGFALAAAGDPAAVTTFEAAADRYAALPAPYPAARAFEEAARLRLPTDAAALTEAAARYERLGATADAARCHQTLRSSGVVNPSHRGRRGYGGDLSPREQQVLRLLHLGRTNRDIAEALSISTRTAEFHVARTLRKVGARSRQDLVRSRVAAPG
ncbi:ATP-binding protein [Amycolatopsis sp. lyj-23]|uniref:ATP-binding protein n=1 Tax=Amycolatopsis sp. lyj-23 TaxID=2789283 RepID=UPI00397DA2A9